MSLLGQFAIATTVILLLGMLTIGYWVTHRISDGVISSHGAAAALYSDSFIEPLVQELATTDRLSSQNQRALDSLFLPQAVGQPVMGFRIWKGDTIVYCDRPELIGKTLPPKAIRQRAWKGHVSVEYNDVEPELGLRVPAQGAMLEIYAPVRQTGTEHIIALAETYQLAPTLEADLAAARLGSWLVVAFVTFHMLLLQLAVVAKGNRTIHEQGVSLDERVAALSRLLTENEDLRQRSNEASHRVSEATENNLRRIGADLHDGPVQTLGMTVFRLDALGDIVKEAEPSIAKEADNEIAIMREALRDTLEEIRSLSAGLAPPEVEALSLTDTLRLVVRRHERRTGSTVTCVLDEILPEVPSSIKLCLYRFAQEGLSNAYRHANGIGQQLTARCDRDSVDVFVDDEGPGLGTHSLSGSGDDAGQGLVGLKDRIEALGGSFSVSSRAGGGTRLQARFSQLPNHRPRE